MIVIMSIKKTMNETIDVAKTIVFHFKGALYNSYLG